MTTAVFCASFVYRQKGGLRGQRGGDLDRPLFCWSFWSAVRLLVGIAPRLAQPPSSERRIRDNTGLWKLRMEVKLHLGYRQYQRAFALGLSDRPPAGKILAALSRWL